MRLIDADRLLTDRMKSKYYHLPNGDIAIPIIDIEHAPTVQPDPDIISRKQAINEIRNTYRVMYSGDMISKVDAVDILNKLPPSSTPSRPKGHWELVSHHGNPPTYVYRCSECHHIVFGLNNFCPNCGADMRS